MYCPEIVDTEKDKEKMIMPERIQTVRYSESFKQKVVGEIKSGMLSIEAARRKYSIGGKMTISNWMKKFTNISKTDNLEITVNDDKERVIENLVKRNKSLEKELTEKETELLLYKTILEISEDLKDPERKKKIEEELLRRLSGRKGSQMERNTG